MDDRERQTQQAAEADQSRRARADERLAPNASDATRLGPADSPPDDAALLARDERLVLAGSLAWFEAVRRVSRSVGHDLANVLTGVSFFASQVDADPGSGTPSIEDAAALADLIARGTRQLDRLRVLWRDPAEAELAPLDPAAIVDGLGPLLTAVAEPCELTLGPLESLVVRASRRALEEALVALVAEARDGARAVRIAVDIEVVDGDESAGVPRARYAAVRVEHDGPVAGGLVAALDASRPATAEGAGHRRPRLGFELAAAAARAVGGGAKSDHLPDGGERVTLLLPEAVSRRRRDEAAGDERPRGGEATPGG